MAVDLPYTLAPSRIPDIFDEIRSSGTPPKFNNEFLKTTLGFTSSNDRAMVKILRALGFIKPGGEPTQRYHDYKGPDSGIAIAEGLREGWADLFMSNREIYKQPTSDITRRVASIAGTNEDISARIAKTFEKLCSLADWSVPDDAENDTDQNDRGVDRSAATVKPTSAAERENPANKPSGLFELHHDIHIHLPATSDPAVYRAVFLAMKAELL